MSSPDQQAFLLLSVGRDYYGLPALLVRRVLDPEELVPLPRMPRFIIGAANVAGRVVAVVDLRAMLGGEPRAKPAAYWLVVDLPEGPMAIAVDGVRQTPPGAHVERLDREPTACVDYWASAEGELFRVLSLRAMYDAMMAMIFKPEPVIAL